jgi:hypothetical protein
MPRNSICLDLIFYFFLHLLLFATAIMAAIVVLEVATVLARVQLNRSMLNRELDALSETDFRTLENRFIFGLVNYTAVIETVLDGWVQKYGCQATIGVLCQALENNNERLASGEFS